jgi:hypothetical protein
LQPDNYRQAEEPQTQQPHWEKAGPPPPGYRKKILNAGGDCPLSVTFSAEQIKRRIAFYGELNRRRRDLPRELRRVRRTVALLGWDDTTTVRVYMRETLSRIAAELFRPGFTLRVQNINYMDASGAVDRDHGHVVATIEAAEAEMRALFEYIRPGASFHVYDGEEARYIPGHTELSEFIITRPEDSLQPARYWRCSQSYIYAIQPVQETSALSVAGLSK